MGNHERRDSKRLKKTFSVFYRVYRKTEAVGDISKIRDISQGGMCIRANQKLVEGDVLELIIRIPYDFNRKIKLFGKVLESKQTKNALEYETRISFIDIDEQTKEFIKSSIEILDVPDKGNVSV